MKIDIRYCSQWNYKPEADGLSAELESFGAEIILHPEGNGIFDVSLDGKLIYSKYETGRFPNSGEVAKLIEK